MQNHCWVGLVGDMEMPAEIDTILRAAAVRAQVSTDKVNLIGWMDLTKLGVLGQKDVNRIGAWCEKLISKNPVGSSVLIGGCVLGRFLFELLVPLDITHASHTQPSYL